MRRASSIPRESAKLSTQSDQRLDEEVSNAVVRIALAELPFVQSPAPSLTFLRDVQRAEEPVIDVSGACQVDITVTQFGAVVHLVQDG